MLVDSIPLEVAASIAILVLLARRPITLAVYAGMPFAISLASSGNNDHLPTLVLAAGLISLPRWWGGLLIGLSVAVKPYTAVFIPAALGSGSMSALAAAIAAALVGWLPALWWGGLAESMAILNAQQGSSPLRFLAIPFALGAFRYGVPAACVAFAALTMTSDWWSWGYLIPLGVAAGIALEPPWPGSPTVGTSSVGAADRSGASGEEEPVRAGHTPPP
jgi:hypothetical protein